VTDQLTSWLQSGRIDLLDAVPEVRELSVRPGIRAAAEEIVCGSEALGIEPWRLDTLLRVVLFADRHFRDASLASPDTRPSVR